MEYNLEIKNLTKNYSNFSLNINELKLPKGSIMGLIGENGSGKSTTIKAIINAIKKDTGEIKIFGNNISDTSNEVAWKQQLGVVLDENHFNDELNINGIHRFMSHIYPTWNKDLFYQYIDKFNLPMAKPIKEFSRGMKMKCNIAVALAHKPKLLILDEATSGLDPVVRNEILDIFLDFIQDEECSIFVSSHITSDLERICDYITFIKDGSVVLTKSKDDILETFFILHCTEQDLYKLNPSILRGVRKNSFGCDVLVELAREEHSKYSDYILDTASLEDIMLYYRKEHSL